ncbi:hypothetical protein O6H91_04G064600 [Diphasiastrum complanatum]|nr:hypothetical protein O6H91_04G064600 [Diphasiastrum complanatum]
MHASSVSKISTMPQIHSITSEQSSFKTMESVILQEDSQKAASSTHPPIMACLCAPTTHAGSFRCRLHRAAAKASAKLSVSYSQQSKADTEAFVPSSSASGNKRLVKLMSRHCATDNCTKSVSSIPRPPYNSRYHSSNKLKTPSRLSKVIFARDVKEDEHALAQAVMPSYSWQPRHSRQIESLQSKPVSMRLLALKKCQGEPRKDLLQPRMSGSAFSPPILSR